MRKLMIDVGNCCLHVRDSGRGFPVVFGHSLTFDSEMWEAQRRALEGRYRVLALDLRGHGATAWQPSEVKLGDLADDVARLFDELEIDCAAYVGLSLGGMVGMRLALRHPERVAALALLNTSAESEDEATRTLYHQSNEASRTAPPGNEAMADFMMSLMFSDAFLQSGAATAPYREKLLTPTHSEGLYQVAKAVIWRESIVEAVPRIDVPSIVITASEDRAIPPARGRALAKALDSELLELEGAGHMTAVERPDAVNAALERLLSELRPA